MLPFIQDVAREIATPAFQQTATLYGILALAISQVGNWIREFNKHKDFRNRSNEIRTLQEKIEKIGNEANRATAEATRAASMAAEKSEGMRDEFIALSATFDLFMKSTDISRAACAKRFEADEEKIFLIVKNGHSK